MWTLVACLICLAVTTHGAIPHCDENCMKPRRPNDEKAFFAVGHHERSLTEQEMNSKLEVIAERRGEKLNWETSAANQTRTQPNILMILVDDLGFGDLSVGPFVGSPANQNAAPGIMGINSPKDKERKDINKATWPCNDQGGILTPHLEKMAKEGVIMSNFHAASPVCSPSRVAITTGVYPWRLGALNAFELGKEMSQRNGFLPQVGAYTQ